MTKTTKISNRCAKEIEQGKAFRALCDRICGPGAAALHRLGLKHAMNALELQISLEQENKLAFHSPAVKRLLDQLLRMSYAAGCALSEDEDRRTKQINAGMVRLGIGKKAA